MLFQNATNPNFVMNVLGQSGVILVCRGERKRTLEMGNLKIQGGDCGVVIIHGSMNI